MKTVTEPAQTVFFSKQTLVFWVDPAQKDGNENGVYVVERTPSHGHFSEEEAIYTLRNEHGHTVEVRHHELRALTDDELLHYYILSGGSICPYCLSDDIEGGFVEIKGDGAYQDVGCKDCDAQWQAVYQLRAFTPL